MNIWIVLKIHFFISNSVSMFPAKKKKKLDLIASMYHLNTIIFVEKEMISRFYSPKSFVLCLLTGFLQLGYSNFWSGQNAWSYKGGWGTVEAGWYIILFHQFNFVGSAFVCAPSEHASLYPFSLLWNHAIMWYDRQSFRVCDLYNLSGAIYTQSKFHFAFPPNLFKHAWFSYCYVLHLHAALLIFSLRKFFLEKWNLQ